MVHASSTLSPFAFQVCILTTVHWILGRRPLCPAEEGRLIICLRPWCCDGAAAVHRRRRLRFLLAGARGTALVPFMSLIDPVSTVQALQRPTISLTFLALLCDIRTSTSSMASGPSPTCA
eukprot:6171931-Pleurochrysis_carterae.AAC.1